MIAAARCCDDWAIVLKSPGSRDDDGHVTWSRAATPQKPVTPAKRREVLAVVKKTCGTSVLLVQAPSGPGEVLLVPQQEPVSYRSLS